MRNAYMLFKCRHGKVRLVSSALKKLKEIIDITEVYGQYDIVAKIAVNNLDELKIFFQNKISIIEGIARTETLISLEKDSTPHIDEELL